MWTVEKPDEVPAGWMLVERLLLDAALIGDRFTDARGRRWILMNRGCCRRCGDFDVLYSEGIDLLHPLEVRIGQPDTVGLVADIDRRVETGRWMLTPAPEPPSAAMPPRAAPDRRRFSLWPFRRKRD